MALTIATASAQKFTDFYDVTYKGAPVENGGYVTSNDWDEWAGWMECDVLFTPKSTFSTVKFNVMADYTATPTFEMSESDPLTYGTPSVCWRSGVMGNCETNTPPTICNFSLSHTTPIEVQFHVLGVDNPDADPDDPSTYALAPTGTGHYLLTIAATVDGKAASDTFSVNLVLGPDAAGVAGVTADDNTPAVYYDLAGRRVLAPAKGQLVIERKGEKARKVIM